MVDPNTKAISVYDYDVMTEVGKLLSLKIEWAEEVGWGVVEQGLQSGRYDMGCNGYWGPPTRTKVASYSIPFVRHPIFVVARPNLAHGELGIQKLNNKKYAMAGLSGTYLDIMRSFYFPEAQLLDGSALDSDGNVLMDVSVGKADFTIANYSPIKRFLKDNPGRLHVFEQPIDTAEGRFLIPSDDIRFKLMIDDALGQLKLSGVLDRIMRKHMGEDKRYWLSLQENQE
jgi:ABC-type amino acid transport substrate-binding protein